MAAVGRGKKVYVVCCEPGAKAALGKLAGADVRDMGAKNLPPAKAGDVQVVITPVGPEEKILGARFVTWEMARARAPW